MTHQTWESLKAELAAGRCPCGDEEEDGSGRGTCCAADGSCATYSYQVDDDGDYVVTQWTRVA